MAMFQLVAWNMNFYYGNWQRVMYVCGCMHFWLFELAAKKYGLSVATRWGERKRGRRKGERRGLLIETSPVEGR